MKDAAITHARLGDSALSASIHPALNDPMAHTEMPVTDRPAAAVDHRPALQWTADS